jgi:hypothetical protein
MKTKEYPTQEFLREKFIYKDGFLFKRIPKDLDGNEFGKKYGFLHLKGYIRTSVKCGNKHYKFPLHRLVWIYHFGEMPDGLQIDHINHNRADNNISNLRLVTPKENLMNKSLYKKNISGQTGVKKQGNSWESQININGKLKCLGSFKNLEDAIKARKEAEILHGYHPNHGREKIREVGQ